MPPESIEDVFHRARAIASPTERQAFLDATCGDDVDLRARVEALLAADAGAGGFLQTADEPEAPAARPDGGPAAGADAGSTSLGPGAVIGRYTLLEEIGTGGFGVVFSAEQTAPITRRVALKVVKAGMDTRQVLARFDAERQALARMDHPAIARVFDAGATDSGRPYFVMELIDGQPITVYADEQNLTVPQRLRLFRQVCAAVQHAHQKGVIHRDLKPSNVMVTQVDEAPIPKVIDFGIAKATAPEHGNRTAVTAAGQFIGTPQYMSPEQAETSGIDVDTRTDVYSLGVLLYEILTGTTPLDPESLQSAGLGEMQRLISEGETPRPSTRLASLATQARIAAHRSTDATRLGLLLRRDLDWIVLKALEKDRERRYATVNGLSVDIQRYLDDEPVTARPPSPVYRLRKFLWKNRVAAAAVLAVATALLLGIAGTTVGMLRALAANVALAETNVTLDKTAEFQASRLQEIDPYKMGIDLRDGVLERARAAMEDSDLEPRQIEENMTALDTLLAGANFTTLARSTLQRNIFDQTLAAIETNFDGEALVQAKLAQALGETLTELGMFDRATEPLTRSLEIRRAQLGEDDTETLESITAVGALLRNQGRIEEAEPYYRGALEGYRRQLGEDDPRTLDALNAMGTWAWSAGDFAEAESLFARALEGQRRVQGETHRATLRSVGNMGALLEAQGRLEEAESYYRTALDAHQRLHGDDHPDTFAACYNLARVVQTPDRLDEAETLARTALEGFRRVLGDDHPNTLQAVNGLGALLHARGRTEEAVVFIGDALESRRRVLGNYHLQTVMSMSNMGAMLRIVGRLDEAAALGAESVEGGRAALGEEHWVVGALLEQQGRTLAVMGRYEEAVSVLLEALPLLTTALGDEHERTVECIEALADVYDARDAADPNQGYDEEAKRWKARLAEAGHAGTDTDADTDADTGTDTDADTGTGTDRVSSGPP